MSRGQAYKLFLKRENYVNNLFLPNHGVLPAKSLQELRNMDETKFR